MKRLKRNMIRDEDGQVMVLFALLMVVILGFAALVIDIGQVQVSRISMQNAADAAALAGAQDLPNTSKAISAAKSVAKINGVDEADIQVVTPYKDDPTKIQVTVKENVKFSFARILGFTDTDVSKDAAAVMKKSWAGEALPFINLDFDYSDTDPIAWTKVGPGVKGTLTDFNTINQGKDNAYFELTYKDGLEVTEGYANGTKGLDDSKLSDGLAIVLKPEDMGVKKVYLFSLRADIIKSRNFTVKDKKNKSKTVSLDKLNDLKEGDVIDPNQLVLIECLFLDLKWANQHDIELKFLGKVYDLGHIGPDGDLPDFPEDYNSSGSGKLRIVE